MKTQRNQKYLVDGNDAADQLLFMLENNILLSDNFKSQISTLVLATVTNFQHNKKLMLERIEKLQSDLKFCRIFSDDFISLIIDGLRATYSFEYNKNK